MPEIEVDHQREFAPVKALRKYVDEILLDVTLRYVALRCVTLRYAAIQLPSLNRLWSSLQYVKVFSPSSTNFVSESILSNICI